MCEGTLYAKMEPRNKNLIIFLALAVCLGLSMSCRTAKAADSNAPVLSSRAAFLRAQRASRQLQQQQQPNINNQTSSTTTSSSASSPTSPAPTTSTTTSAPSSVASSIRSVDASSGSTGRPRLPSSSLISRPKEESAASRPSSSNQQHSNRTTRTADVFQNGDGYNIFVTNTCEREQMNVKITMSREFHGVIHTRNQRQKSICTIEGTGETEYSLVISHVLNPADPNYCGVIKARRESPEDKELLSVVIAVRFHRSIELSDDKFFLLNCTNRCRKADCSEPSLKLREESSPNSEERSTARPGDTAPERRPDDDECNIYKFPWLITLLWCMGIALAALIISHCIMCSSLVCRCVKTEVEEREPSVYEDDETDDEDKLYNRKNNPMRIDYDNRDIYKTSNNYQPYSLDEAQAEQRQARKSKSSQRR